MNENTLNNPNTFDPEFIGKNSCRSFACLNFLVCQKKVGFQFWLWLVCVGASPVKMADNLSTTLPLGYKRNDIMSYILKIVLTVVLSQYNVFIWYFSGFIPNSVIRGKIKPKKYAHEIPVRKEKPFKLKPVRKYIFYISTI